jgi:UDP-N-acetylmuramate: L-alanyl-gamma-D-glutamyl-meso-diaminopimelate ligase
LLKATGKKPGYLVGGIPQDLGRSFAIGQPPYFVIEGDEYDSACFDRVPKFTHYRAKLAVITGIEFDHADIYPNLEAIESAFIKLIDSVAKDGQLLVNALCPVTMKLVQRRPEIVCGYEVHPADSAHTARPHTDWVGVYRP